MSEKRAQATLREKMPRYALGFAEMEEAGQTAISSTAHPKSAGRLLALDLGAKRIGVAVSDELRLIARPLAVLQRRSWKNLLRQVTALVASFDAKALVIGLPLHLDGREGAAAAEVRSMAEKFRRSLSIPVYTQDERLTTTAARSALKSIARTERQIEQEVDSQAATIILRDFIECTRA